MNDRNEFNAINKPSSEALFVANFLRVNKIKYKTEVPIVDLTGSSKTYRKADFYLPNLKVYVEYFGWYNKSKVDRERYDNIANEYIKNSIPTIFIYPHELGFLDYAFHTKLIKVLRVKKFKSKSRLIRYKLARFRRESKHFYRVFILGYVYLVLRNIDPGFTLEFYQLVVILLLIGIFTEIVNAIRDFWNYVVKEK